MSFLSRKKRGNNLVALIDIGSDQISGAIFKAGQKNKFSISSSILFFTQIYLSPQKSTTFKDYFKEINQGLEKVLKTLKDNSYKPEVVFCFLSSPYFITQTKNIVWHSDKKTSVTPQKIYELSQKTAKDFITRHPSLYPEILNDYSVIIENEIMSVILDGYKIDKISGQIANNIEINQYLSIGSASLLGYLKNVIENFFPETSVRFQSFTYTAYSIFKKLLANEKDFLLIDSAGDITDIMVIVDGILIEHRTFPFGHRQIIKKLAELSGTVPAEAESLLKLVMGKKTSQIATTRANQALEKIFISWSNLFQKTIDQIAETVFIPERVYLIGYDDSDFLLANWIKKTNLSDFLLSPRNYLSVGFIDKKMLTYEPINSPGQITNTFVLAEALFCDKLNENPSNFYFINTLKNMQDIVKNKKSLREIFPEVGGKKTKIESKESMPSLNTTRTKTKHCFRLGGLLILLSVILVISIGGFVFSNIFAKAIVNIQPKQGQLDVSNTYIATKEGENGLNFVLAENIEESESTSVTASGSENVAIKASGQIVIINNYSSNSQPLVEKTRFQAPNGNIYRIAEPVTIPGTHKGENGETLPGQLEVTVYADKAGPEHNLGLVDFTIPGFTGSPKFAKIIAKSKTPISGGFVGQRPKISENDMSTLEETMKSSLQAKIVQKIKQQVPENYILFDDAILTRFSVEIATSTEVDSDKVVVRGKITATGILFDQAELSQYLAKAIPGWTGEDKVDVVNLEELNFTLLDKENLNPENLNSFSFNLQGIGYVIWQFDENSLKEDLKKTPKNEYNNVFASYSEITKANIVFRPPWIKKVPQDNSKIEIKIEKKIVE
ncbi:MAG: hypothetical protein WCX70_01205 [Candidatus Paceibacterota bacterium]|jgi:cell division ATPase FtsA/cytoskeletal protein RodZ